MKYKLSISYIVWILEVSVLTVLCSYYNVFHYWNLKLLDYYFEKAGAILQSNSSVRVLLLNSGDITQKTFFKHCLHIATDLKNAGTRCLVIRLPQISTSDDVNNLLHSLDSVGIVVLGHTGKMWITKGKRGKEIEVNFHWTTLDKATTLYSGAFILIPDDDGKTRRILPLHRLSYRSTLILPDISLLVYKKWHNLSDAIAIEHTSNRITMADLDIPLLEDGTMYFHPPNDMFSIQPQRVVAFCGDEGTPLLYKDGSAESQYDSSEMNPIVSKTFRESFQNKIVILKWRGPTGFDVKSTAEEYEYYYAAAIETLLQKKYIYDERKWGLIISFLLVVALGIIGFRIQFYTYVLILSGLGLVYWYSVLWLFLTHWILLDSLTPLATLFLMIILYPRNVIGNNSKEHV